MAERWETTTGTERQRRAARGEGMCECTKDFRWNGETFRQGLSRVAPEWLRDRPELAANFRPLDASTRALYEQLGRGRKRGQLPRRDLADEEPWRLPRRRQATRASPQRQHGPTPPSR